MRGAGGHPEVGQRHAAVDEPALRDPLRHREASDERRDGVRRQCPERAQPQPDAALRIGQVRDRLRKCESFRNVEGCDQRSQARRTKLGVAREQLVGALPVQQHLDADLPRALEHAVLHVVRGAARRLVLGVDQRVEVAGHLLRRRADLVDDRARSAGHHVDPALFVDRGIVRDEAEAMELARAEFVAHRHRER